jgi:hypothetical protein
MTHNTYRHHKESGGGEDNSMDYLAKGYKMTNSLPYNTPRNGKKSTFKI